MYQDGPLIYNLYLVAVELLEQPVRNVINVYDGAE